MRSSIVSPRPCRTMRRGTFSPGARCLGTRRVKRRLRSPGTVRSRTSASAGSGAPERGASARAARASVRAANEDRNARRFTAQASHEDEYEYEDDDDDDDEDEDEDEDE